MIPTIIFWVLLSTCSAQEMLSQFQPPSDPSASLEYAQNAVRALNMANLSPGDIERLIAEEVRNMTASEAMCARDLLHVINGTKHLQLWAFRMIDAATKLQSGILTGNLMDLGQFDECVDIEQPTFTGQHCLVRLVLSIPGAANMTVDVDGSPIPLTTLLGGTKVTFTMGQCFPSTCSNVMIARVYNRLLGKIDEEIQKMNITLTVVINDTDCHLKGHGPMSTADWIVTCFCVILIIVAVISTAIDIFLLKDKEPSAAEKYVKVFSIYTNGKKLFGTKSSSDQLSAINGIKFFSIAWVVLGHRYRYYVQQPIVNLLDVPKFVEEWTKMFILNGTLSVDTFFLVSGLLHAYTFFGHVKKTKRFGPAELLMSYFHRFIRLSPPYFVVIALTATVLYRIGTGPIWDHMVGDARDACAIDWYWNVLYVNNYVTPHRNCLMQSWYLAADMQMFWLAPLALIPLWRWPTFGFIQLIIFILASIASPFAVSYHYDIKQPIPITNDAARVALEMKVLYLPTHTKTVGYVVGILVGYLLYKVKNKKLKVPLGLPHLTLGWAASAAAMLYAIYGCYWLFQTPSPYTRLEAAFYQGFYRFFWVTGVGWVVFMCAIGKGGIINRMLSWKVFWPLGRLTYCVYLTHIAVLLYKMGSFRTTVYMNDFDLVEGYLGDLMISFGVALGLSLLVESPTMGLEKLLLSPGKSRGRPRSAEGTSMDLMENGTRETRLNAGGNQLSY